MAGDFGHKQQEGSPLWEAELEKPSPELLEDSCCLEGVEGPS